MKGKRNLGPVLLLFATMVAADGEKPEIVERAGWNALEARPYTGQEPVRFTIHHSAVQPDPDTDFAKHLRNIQAWGMGEAREWADIPPETIRAHRDLAPTACPGEHLYDSIESGALREAVKEALSGAEEL